MSSQQQQQQEELVVLLEEQEGSQLSLLSSASYNNNNHHHHHPADDDDDEDKDDDDDDDPSSSQQQQQQHPDADHPHMPPPLSSASQDFITHNNNANNIGNNNNNNNATTATPNNNNKSCSSQPPPHPPLPSSSQTQTQHSAEILTQTAADLTQLGDDDDDGFSSSSPFQLLPPYSPSTQRQLPWARLLPSAGNLAAGGCSIDLLPRPPVTSSSSSSSSSSTTSAAKNNNNQTSTTSRRGHAMTWMGLGEHVLLHPSDVFNEYVLGRSPKCDITAINPAATATAAPNQTQSKDNSSSSSSSVKTQQQLELARQQWAFGMISNRHCKIYCCLEDKNNMHTAAAATTTRTGTCTSSSSSPSLQVYCEDCSGNGTLINQEILLRRGEKRLLHTGDEICLVNPQTLQKKVRSSRGLQFLLQQHSFVFVLAASTASALLAKSTAMTGAVPRFLAGAATTTTTSNANNNNNTQTAITTSRKVAVDVRATRTCSMPQQVYKKNAAGVPPVHHSPPLLPSAAAAAAAGLSPTAATTTSRHRRRHSLQHQQQQKRRRVEEDYDIRELLGSGTVGEVRRAIHRQTGQERAIKIIALQRNRHHLLTSAAAAAAAAGSPSATSALEAEATILRGLSHPYVVQLIDVYVSDAAISLVMELLHGGDLFDRIVAKGRYTEVESRRVMRRLLSAIHYLHVDCNIVHRDLKPENILLENYCSHIQVKLTDFGLAKSLNGVTGLKTFCGTPQYFAPEVLKRRSTVMGRGRYGQQADMWSLGVIVYILLSGTPPFDVDNDQDHGDGGSGSSSLQQSMYHRVQFDPADWEGVSHSARDFCKRLLVTDPQSRLTVQQACEHEWILTPDGDTHCHPLQDPQVLLHAAAATTTTPANNNSNNEDALEATTSNNKNDAVVATAAAVEASTQKTNSKDDKQVGDCKKEVIDTTMMTTTISTKDKRGNERLEGAKNEDAEASFVANSNYSTSDIQPEPPAKVEDNDGGRGNMPLEKEETVETNNDVSEKDTCGRSALLVDTLLVSDTTTVEETKTKFSSSTEEKLGDQMATSCVDVSLIDGSNKTQSQPCTMNPARSESFPEREDRAPLSPVQLNHEFASTQKVILKDDGDNVKKLQMPLTSEEVNEKDDNSKAKLTTTLNTKLMLKAPASWKRSAVGRVSEADERGQKKPPPAAAAKLELSDDSVGDFSNETESISSFTSIAENCEAKSDSATVALPRKRRVTDTMGDSLARLEPPPAIKKKKVKNSTTTKQSQPATNKSSKSKDAHSKQAKLSKWFQTSNT